MRPASEVERRRLNEHVRRALRDPRARSGTSARSPTASPASCARSGSRSRRTTPARRSAAAPATCSRACPAAASARSCSARTSTRSRTAAPIEPVARRRRLGERGRHDPRRRQQGGGRGAARARAPRRGRGRAGRRRAAVHGRRGERRWRARRRSTSRGCARDFGYVFDHATPIGEVVVASPTYYRLEARVPRPGRPRRHPARGRAQRDPRRGEGDRRDAARPPRRRDDRERRQRSTAAPAGRTSSPSAARCSPRRARWTRRRPRRRRRDGRPLHDAANDPLCECDVDVDRRAAVRRLPPQAVAPAVVAAEAALRACGYTPRRIDTGGGVGRQRVRGRRPAVHEPRQRHRAQPRADRARQPGRAARACST